MSCLSPYPLSMSQEGEIVNISLLRGGKHFEIRLMSLGLYAGAEVKVSQREGANLVVLRGETRIALGAGMAHKIMVIRKS